MFIIAGLGNPEKKYDGTRHNSGFAVIDLLAKQNQIPYGGTKFRSAVKTAYLYESERRGHRGGLRLL